MNHTQQTKVSKDRRDRGSILLHLVVILVVTGLIGTAMISFMSTSVNQQVFSGTAVQAELLAESGFRYMTARYKAESGEINKNTVLKNLHGRTLILDGNDGRFHLDIQPYFYTARSNLPAGSTQIPAEYPGVRPTGTNPPVSGRLGIFSGSRYTLYTYSSRSGDDTAFTFEGILNALDTTPGLDGPLSSGATVHPVLTCDPVALTSGAGNSLTVPDANRLLPQEDGVFAIINHAGEFRDASGTRTGIYSYKTRSGNTLSDIRVFNNPGATFSLNLDADSRIVVHRSARIAATGTVHAGTDRETNRIFAVMVGLGETVVTATASDLIYDNPDNLLGALIDRAQVLGDSDTVSGGKIGDAMAFDGDMDYVRLDDDPSLDLSTEGSIGAWIKVTAFDNNFSGIIRKGGAADGSDLAYSLQFRPPDRIRFEIHSTTSSLRLDSDTSLDEGFWYHVAATWGPAGMYIYIDGIEDAFLPETLVVQNTDGSVQIGAQLDEIANPSQKNYGFHGILDEVFIYNTQEDLCGIRAIFSNPCNTGCDALAFYPFDGNFRDASGENKAGDRANDASGTRPSLTSDRFGCSDQAVFLPPNFFGFSPGNYLEIGAESPFDFTGPFTVSAWVQVGSWSWLLSDDSFVAKGLDSFRLQRYNTSSNATFGTTGLTRVETVGNDTIGDGRWHHLVGVYDGSRKTLYVDGVRDAFSSVGGNLDQNNDRVRLGTYYGITWFQASMDEVGFWGRALDADEVFTIYRGLRTDRSLP